MNTLYLDAHIYMAVHTPRPFYRVLHDLEMVHLGLIDQLWRPALPEVFPLDPVDSTDMTREWQILSYQLNKGMTGEHWRSLYAFNRAFTNGTGFNDDGNPRADFVNLRDLGAPLPKWDKCRECGGAMLRGVEEGSLLVVETLDGNQPPPPLAWILARPWLYFDAVSVTASGTITRFPQGDGQRVRVPLVATMKVTLPLTELQKLSPLSVFPNPYVIYF